MNLIFHKPKAQKDWDEIGITSLQFLTSGGATGCVFVGKQREELRLFKVIFAHNEQEIKDVKREAYIGHFLHSRLPENVRDMFAETKELIIADALPPNWMNELDDVCRDERAPDSIQVFVLIQRLIASPGIVLDSWLSRSFKQNKWVDGEIIRAFLFQMVVALGVAQYELGFVHNDLKLENVLAIPVTKETQKTFIINGDLFQLNIPAGGFIPVLIDFGASLLVTSENSKDWPMEPLVMHTVGHAPFDRAEYDHLLRLRSVDSDLMALFTMALNLLVQNRNAFPSGFGETDLKWTHEENSAGFFYWIDSTLENSGTNLAKTLFTFKKNQKPTQQDIDMSLSFSIYVIMARALGIDLQENAEIPEGEDLFTLFIDQNSKFYQALNSIKVEGEANGKIFTLFNQVPRLLESVFGKDGLSFFRRLFEPWARQRLAFGVPEYPKFNLANALYHPFLASKYWIGSQQNGSENIQMLEPLLYRSDVNPVVEDIKANLQQLEQSFLEEDVDITPPASPSPSPLSTSFYVDNHQLSGKPKNAEKGAYMLNILKECVDMFYPKNGDGSNLNVKTMVEKHIVPLSTIANTLSATNKTLLIKNFPISEDDVPFWPSGIGTVVDEKLKSTTDNFKFLPIKVGDINDAEDVLFSFAPWIVNYLTVAQVFNGANTQASLTKEMGAIELLRDIEEDISISDMISAIRTIFIPLFEKANMQLMQMQIISEKLKQIEQQEEFLMEKGEFNLTAIKDQLLVPVFHRMQDFEEMNLIQQNIHQELSNTSLENMDERMQLQFFHKMGIVASMMHTQEFTPIIK